MRKAAAKAARRAERAERSSSVSSSSSPRIFGGSLGVVGAVVQPVSSVGGLAQQTMLIDVANVRVQ
jgi:hypothetical protein